MSKLKYIITLSLLVFLSSVSSVQAKGPVDENLSISVNPVKAGEHTELVYEIENKSNAPLPVDLKLNHWGRWWSSYYPYYMENINQTWTDCKYYTCEHTFEGTIPGKQKAVIKIDLGTRHYVYGTYQDAITTSLYVRNLEVATNSIDMTTTR